LWARPRSYGLKAKPELRIQFGAGGDRAAEGLGGTGTSDPSKVVQLGRPFMGVGGERVSYSIRSA
jgi:hypothetical protein